MASDQTPATPTPKGWLAKLRASKMPGLMAAGLVIAAFGGGASFPAIALVFRINRNSYKANDPERRPTLISRSGESLLAATTQGQ